MYDSCYMEFLYIHVGVVTYFSVAFNLQYTLWMTMIYQIYSLVPAIIHSILTYCCHPFTYILYATVIHNPFTIYIYIYISILRCFSGFGWPRAGNEHLLCWPKVKHRKSDIYAIYVTPDTNTFNVFLHLSDHFEHFFVRIFLYYETPTGVTWMRYMQLQCHIYIHIYIYIYHFSESHMRYMRGHI